MYLRIFKIARSKWKAVFRSAERGLKRQIWYKIPHIHRHKSTVSTKKGALSFPIVDVHHNDIFFFLSKVLFPLWLLLLLLNYSLTTSILACHATLTWHCQAKFVGFKPPDMHLTFWHLSEDFLWFESKIDCHVCTASPCFLLQYKLQPSTGGIFTETLIRAFFKDY